MNPFSYLDNKPEVLHLGDYELVLINIGLESSSLEPRYNLINFLVIVL